jgi:membrane-associated phospholipid phosphatase
MPEFARLRATWWLPYAVGAALAAGAMAVMVWQVVARGPFIAADWPVHEFFQPRVPDGAAQVLLDTISRPGQRWLTLPIMLVAGGFVSWRFRQAERGQWWRPTLAVLVGLGSAYVVGKAIKDGLGRTPPYRNVDELHGIGEAFPSGHVANASLTWALITVLVFGVRGVWPNRRRAQIGLAVSAGLVLVVGTIMVVMDYHWLTDIPGGIAVGVFALMLALIALGPPGPRSAEDQRGRDGSEALTPPSEPEPIGRGGSD